MTASKQAVTLIDRRPFFEKALTHGLRNRIIDHAKCEAIIKDGAKGAVQVAEHFGTSFLQADLENARRRIVSLVSLYLEESTNGDLDQAAQSLRDNSFLFHSRSGNDLLKQLHALPESTIGGDSHSQSLKDFQNKHTLDKPFTLAAYRKERKRRLEAQATTAAAHWFADQLQVVRASLDFVPLEAVIRSALLARHAGTDKLPNHGEFTRMIVTLRAAAGAKKKLQLPKNLLDDVPLDHRKVAEAIRIEIEKQDGPLIANPAQPLAAVLPILEVRYFLRDADIDDIDGFAGFVSDEWQAATKGKDDPYSRLTLFMCLATGVKPKTIISETEARSMVRHVRKSGFDSAAVLSFIDHSAPHELTDSLISQWESEFLPEAEQRVLDDSDTTLQRALVFLKDNLNIKVARKSAA